MRVIPEILDLILLNIGFSEHHANWNWKSVSSPFARLYYITEGEAQIKIKNKTINLQPEHLYLTPPFTLHDNECSSYFSHYYIHFYENTTHKEPIFDKYEFPLEIKASVLDIHLIKKLLEINPDRQLMQTDPLLYDNIPNFSRYIAENKRLPEYSIIETQGILLQLISRFYKFAVIKSHNKDIRITKSLQFIHENAHLDLSVSSLADISCITQDHFIRIFKKEMKCTPLKYINLKKMEKAQLLLLTTDIPIKDIALELSIDNTSYFNRIFKQHTGITPSEYRKNYTS